MEFGELDERERDQVKRRDETRREAERMWHGGGRGTVKMIRFGDGPRRFGIGGRGEWKVVWI